MLSIGMILLCVVLRVVPHPANFAPVGATAVFAGRHFSRRTAVLITWGAMFTGDVLLSYFHGYPLFTVTSLFVYGGFGLQALLGFFFRERFVGGILAAGLGSIGFFLLSNFGVWLEGGLYPYTPAGLLSCYVAAIPFFPATLAADLVWILLLMGAYRFASARLSAHSLRIET